MSSVFSRQTGSRRSSSWTEARDPTTSLQQIGLEIPQKRDPSRVGSRCQAVRLSWHTPNLQFPPRPRRRPRVRRKPNDARNGGARRARDHWGSGLMPPQVTAAQTQRSTTSQPWPGLRPRFPVPTLVAANSSVNQKRAWSQPTITSPHRKPLPLPVTEPDAVARANARSGPTCVAA